MSEIKDLFHIPNEEDKEEDINKNISKESEEPLNIIEPPKETKPKKKRKELTQERREQLKIQLKKGRITALKNRQAKAQIKYNNKNYVNNNLKNEIKKLQEQ